MIVIENRVVGRYLLIIIIKVIPFFLAKSRDVPTFSRESSFHIRTGLNSTVKDKFA